MPPRNPLALDVAEALLARARRDLPVMQRMFVLLVASLVAIVDEPRHARRAGQILEEIARTKYYVFGGHRTWNAFLRDALGVSRTTAYRLRRIALATEVDPIENGKMAAYEQARVASPHLGRRARARTRKT